MKKTLVSLLLIGSCSNVFAVGFPVMDIGSILQLMKMYEQNITMIQNGVDKLENAKNQLESMTHLTYY